MSEWRRLAMELVPELSDSMAQVSNRTELWDELRNAFLQAAESRNSGTCAAIVKYYRWCVNPDRQKLPNDVQTSAVLGFLEKFVRTETQIDLLLKWLSREEVLEYSSNVEYSGGKEAIAYISSISKGKR